MALNGIKRLKLSRIKSRKASSDPVTVRFWGVRGSIPVPGVSTARFGGNTSCVEFRCGSQRLILDAGTGIRGLGSALLLEQPSGPLKVDLLLSHLHWDHIQGLPFFQPIYQAGHRLRIFGPSGPRLSLAEAFRLQMRSPLFPVDLRRLPSRPRFQKVSAGSFRIGRLKVDAIRVNHPDGCLGYRLSVAGLSVVYLPDCELAKRLSRRPRPALADRELAAFIQGADLVIMDSQYDMSEYSRHVGWGHGCLEDVVELACRAHVRKLALFHHDPDHDDRTIASRLRRARALARSRGSSMLIEAAQEGLTLSCSAAP